MGVLRATVNVGNSALQVAMPELYPIRVRSTGTGVANWLGGCLGSIPCAWLVYSEAPPMVIAAVLGGCNLLAALLALALPETAGVEIDATLPFAPAPASKRQTGQSYSTFVSA